MMVILLIASATIAAAQISLGPKIGINSAGAEIQLRFGESFKPSARKGLIVGGVIKYDMGGAFALQVEPQYTRKGYRLDDTFSGKPLTVIANLGYIELPVTLQAGITFNKLKAYLLAGPNFGFRMSAQVSSVLPNTVETNNVEYSTKDFDLGIDVGVGLAFELNSTTTLFTDGRLSRGLMNVDRTGDTYYSRDTKVSVGLLFKME